MLNENIFDSLFNNDLDFSGVKLYNFTPKLEFEMAGLFRKIQNKANDTDKIDIEFLYDKIDFNLIEKIAKWMDTNTNINENFIKNGELANKVLVFIEIFMDYVEFKKKLKETSSLPLKVELPNETVKPAN